MAEGVNEDMLNGISQYGYMDSKSWCADVCVRGWMRVHVCSSDSIILDTSHGWEGVRWQSCGMDGGNEKNENEHERVLFVFPSTFQPRKNNLKRKVNVKGPFTTPLCEQEMTEDEVI